ncbi:hypothetical protein SAMN06272735_1276 [Streptomyces sp. TLI_55]|uniref:hypothetical protein n=1 Tax=Streptomyces sp. TLI_55 TaxID=1938861 RepID=UPI000BCE1138|nr:hypothetical protein [Streptomyces sp. TLI_55]SNX56821.1 hypothetical protein SAMN06272735_1276 [Streptomyces sp. TLI_55]
MSSRKPATHQPAPPAPEPSAALRAAADRLTELAGECPQDSTGRSVLTWIADDARAGGRALSGVNLLHAYPPDALVPDAEPRHSGLIAVVSTARDVSVFLPIVLTWLSLWFAFRDFEDSAKGTNFLRLWSSGFGGTAVLLVVLLIAGVVLATMWLQRLEWAAQHEASREGLRTRIAGQLTVLTMELSKHAVLEAQVVPAGQLVGIARDITRSTAELSRTLSDSADRMERIFAPGPEGRFVTALDQWTRSAGELGEMGRSLTVPHQLLRDFAKMRDELRGDEQATRESLTRLLAELRRAAGSSQEANRVHATVADEVTETTRRVGEAMGVLNDNSERMYAYMDALERVLALLQNGSGPAPMSNSGGPSTGPYGGPYGGPHNGPYNGNGYPGGGSGGPAAPPPPPPAPPRTDTGGSDTAAPDTGAATPPPRRPGDDWYGGEQR